MARNEPFAWSPLKAVTAAALVLLATYLLAPALTATHVEGFTAALQMDAIAAHRHLVDRADLLYPVQTEYLYLTRQGVALLLRGLMQLTGSTGDGLFRALTLASLLVFLACTALVARRHAALGWGVTLASLLTIPGIFELGFFFSDGVVAVAFGTAGLALLPRAAGAGRPSVAWLLRSLASGLALGMAVLCRADALLMLPLALGLASLDQRRRVQLALLGGLVVAGMLVAFGLAQAVSGTTLLDALRVGRFFDMLHGRIRVVFVRALVFALFFGLPGLAFVAIGVLRTWRAETPWRRTVLLGLPGLVLLYALRSATEVRQIYPYTAPFAVLLCARGLEWVVGALDAVPPLRRRAAALLAASALVWLLPPVFVPIKDGPRTLLGRLWSPPLWRIWQQRVEASLDDVDALIARAGQTRRMVVVSAHFNTDHYLQLRAWQRGWVPQRPQETHDRCGGGVEVWRNGTHELVALRLDNTYGLSRISGEDYIAVHLNDALACPVFADTPAYVSDFWPPLSTEPASQALRRQLPPEPQAERFFAWPAALADPIRVAWGGRSTLVPLSYGINRTGPLTSAQLAEARALSELRLAEARARPAGEPIPGMDELLARLQARYWKLPVSAPTDGPAGPLPP